MKFMIEQIAIYPKDPVRAKQLLKDLGAEEWAEDHVCATGQVFGKDGSNEADLSFNYDIFAGREFEVLDYTAGENWMDSMHCSADENWMDSVFRGRNNVSHLGMHCSADELVQWRAFFKERNIGVAQEVMTDSHTNPVIAGKRWYNYVIFDTKDILGVDLKFIVRRETKD